MRLRVLKGEIWRGSWRIGVGGMFEIEDAVESARLISLGVCEEVVLPKQEPKPAPAVLLDKKTEEQEPKKLTRKRKSKKARQE